MEFFLKNGCGLAQRKELCPNLFTIIVFNTFYLTLLVKYLTFVT